ncbi:MAG: response regulator [Verrucomicrobiota bacterium]
MGIKNNAFKILLAEDDDNHAELILYTMSNNGFECHIDRVADGEKALKFLRKEAPYNEAEFPDLLLLDLKMPRVDGLDVLCEIKVDPMLRLLPVIMLTTSNAKVDRVKAYANHVNSYITKPMDFEELSKLTKLIFDYWENWNQNIRDIKPEDLSKLNTE